MADLLKKLQASLSLSYLFISHDLRMAAQLATTIAVMKDGRIVDYRSIGELFSHPQEDETRNLIRSIPQVTAPLYTRADSGA